MLKKKMAFLKENTDPFVFISSSLLILVFFFGAIFFEDQLLNSLLMTKDLILEQLGWVYSLSLIFILFCVIYIYIKFGHIKIGGPNDTPEFSTPTWLAMLFSTGMGTGLIYSGVFEPLSHYTEAPHIQSVRPTLEKYILSQHITFFHWGIPAWGIYSLFALIFAYHGFNLKKGFEFSQFISERYPLLKKLVNVLTILSILAGLSTTFIIASEQIVSGSKNLFFSSSQFITPTTVIIFVTICTSISLLTGLHRGIKYLSVLNIFIAFLFFTYFLFSYIPTLEFVKTTASILKSHFILFPKTLFYDSFVLNTHWLGQWSILYWAWWIAWTPFVGLFIAKISKGRTIKEFLFFSISIPSAVSFLWFSLFGFAGYLNQVNGAANFKKILSTSPHDSLFVVINSTPFPLVASFLAVLCVTIFYITSSDSGSFVVDMISSKKNQPSSPIIKIYWSFLEGTLAIILLKLGGIHIIKTIIIIFSLPTLAYLMYGVLSLIKNLKSEGNTKPRN